MSTQTVVEVKAVQARRIPDPLQNETSKIEHHRFLVPAKELPKLPFGPNPRGQNPNRRIYKEVRRSLTDATDLTFHLKNRGLFVVANSVVLLQEVTDENQPQSNKPFQITFNEGQGILDGGHTYRIIEDEQSSGRIPIGQYVWMEVVTGLTREQIEAIARGLNTSIQVSEMAMANLEGRFNWIEQILSSKPYGGEIAYRDNDPGEFDARDIVAIMTLFNIDEYPSAEKVPLHTYRSKEKCLEQFVNNSETYEKMKDILPDILCLHDHIQKVATESYARLGGRTGRLAFVEMANGEGKLKLVFLGEESDYRLFAGALFPMLGAFRALVEQKDGESTYSWKTNSFNDVKKIAKTLASQFMTATRQTSDDNGRQPSAIGRDKSHWQNLYRMVELEFLKNYFNRSNSTKELPRRRIILKK